LSVGKVFLTYIFDIHDYISTVVIIQHVLNLDLN
jgi:hypothetical protein